MGEAAILLNELLSGHFLITCGLRLVLILGLLLCRSPCSIHGHLTRRSDIPLWWSAYDLRSYSYRAWPSTLFACRPGQPHKNGGKWPFRASCCEGKKPCPSSRSQQIEATLAQPIQPWTYNTFPSSFDLQLWCGCSYSFIQVSYNKVLAYSLACSMSNLRSSKVFVGSVIGNLSNTFW